MCLQTGKEATIIRIEHRTRVIRNQPNDLFGRIPTFDKPGTVDWMKPCLSQIRGVADVVQPCGCGNRGVDGPSGEIGLSDTTDALYVRPTTAETAQVLR